MMIKGGIRIGGLGVKRGATTSPLLDGLLAYWKLDTTGWIDSSGNGNTLTNNNGVTLGTGKINGDAVFDPNLSNSLTRNISIGSSYSISAWVKIPAFGFDGGACAIGSSSNNNSPAIVTSLGTTYFFYGVNGAGDCNPATSADALGLDTWYHIVGTSDAGSSTCKWYLNGTVVSEDSFSDLIGTDELQLGAYDARSLPTFSGDIDEVGVWNRALTGAEITSLYNAGAGKTYPFV
jgi:hypothetical protein